jgi:hypothetical protein
MMDYQRKGSEKLLINVKTRKATAVFDCSSKVVLPTPLEPVITQESS